MSKPRILIADDDPAFVRALTLRLHAAGFDVTIASEGEDPGALTLAPRPDQRIFHQGPLWPVRISSVAAADMVA